MNAKPKCVIATGRQGSGKTALAKKPRSAAMDAAIIRDDIEEGCINTIAPPVTEKPERF